MPAIVETVHRGISGSERAIFEQCTHMAHLEEEGHYPRVVNDGMSRVVEQA